MTNSCENAEMVCQIQTQVQLAQEVKSSLSTNPDIACGRFWKNSINFILYSLDASLVNPANVPINLLA